MYSKPSVSVVVGYYNRRDVLEQTLDSILDQSFADLELIVFDDASVDGTARALQDYKERRRDPRLRVITHEKNRGFVWGMINAIKQSSGEYIAIQGSGDISLPNRIERQVELLRRRTEVVAVGCWYTNLNQSTGSYETVHPNADTATFEDLLERNFFTHGEVMYRRNAYERAGGYRPEFTFVQDLDLWIRMRKLGNFATVPEVLYERTIRGDGVTSNLDKFAHQVRFPVLARKLALLSNDEQESILERVRAHGIESVVPLEDKVVQDRYVEHVRVLAWAGRSKEAVGVARRFVTSRHIKYFLMAFFTLYQWPVVGSALRLVVSLLRKAKSHG